MKVRIRATKNWPARLTPQLRKWLKLRIEEMADDIEAAVKQVEKHHGWQIQMQFRGHEDDAPHKGDNQSGVVWVSVDYVMGIRRIVGTFDNYQGCGHSEEANIAEFEIS